MKKFNNLRVCKYKNVQKIMVKFEKFYENMRNCQNVLLHMRLLEKA